MSNGSLVDLVASNSSKNQYIIKDKLGITIGRIYIIEIDKNNKNCTLRLKFYKNSNIDEYVKDILKLVLGMLFNNNKIAKVNILCSEDLSTIAFNDLGFELEGILSNNIINSNNKNEDELIFGIERSLYESNYITSRGIIKGNKITLKILTPEDGEDLLDYYLKNRKYLEPFEPSREESFYTLDSQKNDLIKSYKQFIRGEEAHFGIYVDNKLSGRIKISNIVMGIFKSGFIGYSIDEHEQGNGYAKEALKLALKFAFNELDLHRVEASTLLDNLKSQGVLKSCGFLEVGISKEYLYINGSWKDHKIFYKNRQ
ncbi:GNAT family N-acetyltransferase [Clostridium ihumii]|uniref:GNAT family N-acetyltransferase n=1 Tax=Clostridium ihumii TaxID=1470356 RepID=UPI00058F176C|nr:GNAT family protein [Clostridium ihumii]